MSGRRRARWWRRWRVRIAVPAALVAATLAVGFGPRLLRTMDAFRVRRVEVVGTRFIEPYAVVRAAGLDRDASVFDDPDAWRAGVRTLPLVEDVRVRRHLPATVTVAVREVAPLALVAGEELRPVDAGGRLLELDPAGIVLDIPVLTGVRIEGGRVTGADSQGALWMLAALRARAPKLAERIAQVERLDGALRVLFRDGRAEALLPLRPSDTQLTQLRVTVADLAARGELDAVRRIDVRFRDQVVVSFHGTPVS